MALEGTLTRSGNGVALIVSKDIRNLYEWEAGDTIAVALVSGGEKHELTMRNLSGGTNVGIYVPAAIMRKYGFRVGDVIPVPYKEWAMVRKAPKPTASTPAKPKRRQPPTKRPNGATKKAAPRKTAKTAR